MARFGALGQCDDNGRHEGQACDAVVLDVVQHFAEIELLHHIDGDALARRRNAVHRLPVGVVHGEHGKADAAGCDGLEVRVELCHVVGLRAVADVVQVRDLDALGDARRAGRVIEDDRLLHLLGRVEFLPAVAGALFRRGQQGGPVLDVSARGLSLAVESVVAAVEAEDLVLGETNALRSLERSVQRAL